jgi:hypothetical protein
MVDLLGWKKDKAKGGYLVVTMGFLVDCELVVTMVD